MFYIIPNNNPSKGASEIISCLTLSLEVPEGLQLFQQFPPLLRQHSSGW